MRTLRIEIEPKKGEKITLLFGVWQEFPCSYFDGNSSLRWRTGNELFPQYGDKVGLKNVFNVAMLRPDWTKANAKNNRNDYAGFIPYHDGRGEKPAPLPGSFNFRGAFMGEITARIEMRDGYENPEPWADWRSQICEHFTPGQREFLNAQILPALAEFIRANREALRQDAIACVKEQIAGVLADARKSLREMEAEAAAAIAKL